MKYSIVVFICVFFVSYHHASRIVTTASVDYAEDDNEVPLADYLKSDQPLRHHRDYVKVNHSSPAVMTVKPGSQIEFVCDSAGVPIPTVRWLHSSTPVSETIIEKNYVDGFSVGRTSSIYKINCVTHKHQGVYTCVGQAGTAKAVSLPVILNVEDVSTVGPDCLCTEEKMFPPRIVSFTQTFLDMTGHNVLLPCRAIGNPTPEIFWVDSEKCLITKSDNAYSRYKILDTGDLLILKIQWSDMGNIRCVAENFLGRDTRTTFLYPLADG